MGLCDNFVVAGVFLLDPNKVYYWQSDIDNEHACSIALKLGYIPNLYLKGKAFWKIPYAHRLFVSYYKFLQIEF